ncbi:tryptophan 7-halogenase, partial [Escherichia coli]|nr:tryptophan 7-halogenase [Escherichia coli]
IAVLLGQGVMPRGWDPLADGLDDDKLATSLARIHEMFARAALAMPRHEDWLARNAPARTGS